MNTLGDMAKSLNRSALYLHGLQGRFELPVYDGAGYSDAYLALLRTIVFLRMLNVSADSLIDLWHLEKKLLQLLHVDSTGSPTWYLDSCGQMDHVRRRLLLTNHDTGIMLTAKNVQLGLNFGKALPELFTGTDMGEDALRVAREYVKLYTRIQADVNDEICLTRAATRWSSRMK